MSSPIGRLLIAIEGAVQNLQFDSDSEREEYLDDLSRTLQEQLRQNLLTWRSNYHNRECGLQAQIANSIVPTPDHVERESERAAAKRLRA